jgi:hypothetical protein
MPAVAIKPEVVPPDIGEESVLQGTMKNGKWNGKYNIYDPRTVKYVERTPFLRGICGHIDQQDTLEDVIRGNRSMLATRAQIDLREMAQTYYMYRNKGARLPKFSRWVTGMFSGNPEYAKILAEEGQKAAKRKIIMSVDVVDILRCADTPHFRSCFVKGDPMYRNDGYDKIPVKIAEECPGIGIVYVDDENGFMMGRQWMHHAKVKDTGEDIIVLTQSQYGCLDGGNVARLLAERGIRVGVGSYYGEPPEGFERGVEVEYVGCFKESLHHDLATWTKNPKIALLKPAFIKNKTKE